MRQFIAEIDRRDRVLSRLGWFQIVLAVLMLAAMPFDHRTILGLSPWIKPGKFAVSIAIYAWTLAWFMPYLTGPRWAKGLVRWGTAVAMVVEILCIAGQSWRGTTSHFNNATPLDCAIFGTMGLFILFTMLLDVLFLALLFTHHQPLPAAYLWGIRLGLVGVLVAGGIGYFMVRHLAHSVGGRDGGPGLPIVNWSTEWGDLRVSHAVGLHALQILPLMGFGLSRARRLSPRLQTGALVAVAVLYALVTGATFWQAADGRPLVGDNRLESRQYEAI
jgi:hypothetical protein